MPVTDTRAVTLVDIPLLKRLGDQGTVLNSELGLTRDARGPNSALLSSILFSRELYTLVARADKQQVVGQFRYKAEELNAHIVYLAPRLDDVADDTPWLHILDAMAREAGKHGAHTLVAEVEETSHLFETMRTAGFAVYARQMIWRHEPFEEALPDPEIELTEVTEAEEISVTALICSMIPSMVQQVAAPPSDMRGLVYRKNGRIEGYVALTEGKYGLYIIPYLHQDIRAEAHRVLAAAIRLCERAARVPVYVCVRAYHSWLDSAMEKLGFEPWVEQAVMVRHIAAGVRHAQFAPVRLRGTWDVTRIATLPPASRMNNPLPAPACF